MTPAVKGKLAPAKGADHKNPIQHWHMAPGLAWLLTTEGRETATISKEQAARAVFTFNLIWHQKGTAAVFALDGKEYAQPLEAIPEPRRKKVERTAPQPRSEPPVVDNPVEKVDKKRKPAKKPIALQW